MVPNVASRLRSSTAPLVGVVVFLFAFRAYLLVVRSFDPDELQHFHGAYCMASGLRPFVDYFEHHPPLFGWLLSLVYRAGGPEWGTLLAGRALMLALTGGILWCTHCTVRRVTGTRTAWTALAFLSGTLLFLDKSLEIRPDVPATLCWMIGLRRVVRALKDPRRTHWVIGGLAFGCGLMFTPKLAFGVLGAGLGLVWSGVRPRDLATLVGASLVPVALCALAYAATGTLVGFVENVVLLSLEWERELPASRFLIALLEENPAVALLGAAGLLWVLRDALHARAARPEAPVVALASLSILAGWFLVPVPWPQFLLPLFPLLSYCAALACGRVCAGERPSTGLVVSWLAVVAVVAYFAASPHVSGRALASAIEPTAWMAAAALALSCGGRARLPLALACVGLALWRVQPLPVPFALPWALLAGCVLLALPEERPWATLVAGLLAAPLVATAGRADDRNDEQRAEFDAIMERTSPDDTVLTSWRGTAVFRPHAYYYFFLHPGVRRMLEEENLGEDLLRLLAEEPPAAVIRDEHLRALDSGVGRFLDEHYRRHGGTDLWFRTRTDTE